jgi:UDP:flavonoid glycosyltransferase YjiC (YdhE family)
MAKTKVLLVTFGSYGDLHPFIALAHELKALGLEPMIATGEVYRDKVEREGIAFYPVRPTMTQLLADVGLTAEQFARAITERPVKYLLSKGVLPYIGQAYDDLLPVMADAQLVAMSSFCFSAQMAAEALGKPTINVVLSPIVMTSDDDPPLSEQLPILPALRRLFGPGLVRWLYKAGRSQFRFIEAAIDAQRRAVGLPREPDVPFTDFPYRCDEVVALYSPSLGGARLNPPKPTAIAGQAFFDRDGPDGQALTPEAEAFLAVGPPPLVFTVGSFATLAAARFYGEAAKAARKLKRRAILLVGRDAEAELRAKLGGPDILVLGYAPHSLLFPRAAVNIHHGGIGTTGQALRAGVPQLVVPMFGDQPDNAYRIERLGVGAVLPFKKFNFRSAAKALKPLLNNALIRQRAADGGEAVRQENGAKLLAEHIAQRLGSAQRL